MYTHTVKKHSKVTTKASDSMYMYIMFIHKNKAIPIQKQDHVYITCPTESGTITVSESWENMTKKGIVVLVPTYNNEGQ